MKKSSLLSVLPLLLITVTPALAENSDRKEIREDAVKMRQELRTNRQETKVTKAQSRLEFRRQQLTKTYGVIKKNLETRFTYLTTTLKSQVQAKIDARKTAGKDVSAATAKMAEFNTDAYTKDLAALEAKYQEMLASNEPKKNLGELNKLANNVRHDLNAMRQTLMDAFRLAIRAK